MFVYFWGTRASLPASSGLKYGVNTSCVQIEDPDGDYIFCDAGTGLRDFSDCFMQTPESKQPQTFHIFLSHLHWDHIQGFPFFAPAYQEGNRILVHSHHNEAEYALQTQMSYPFFPVDFGDLKADIVFDVQLPGMPFDVNAFHVTSIEQIHPGTSYGFRFVREGKSIVYSTDAGHPQSIDLENYPFVDFFRNADLLIFDGQYSPDQLQGSREHWGHSSNQMGVDLATAADVKRLVLFHQESSSSEQDLDLFLAQTLKYAKEKGFPGKVSFAKDGLKLEL